MNIMSAIDHRPTLAPCKATACRFVASAAVLVAVLTTPAAADDAMHRLAKVVGTTQANCKQCHPSEVAHWEKTTHFRSLNRLQYAGNSKKYADAMGIASSTLMTTSLCADCHGTRSLVDGAPQVVSGVSCESCHGAARDWLKSHGEYTEGQTFTTLSALRAARSDEVAEHRVQRLESTRKAGMIRPEMLHELARNCLQCHVVGNEQLIAAGHKVASNFELLSWLNGEVRHNFFEDAHTNAAAPSLWQSTTGRTPEQRDRLKFVVGGMTQLEVALQKRAEAASPVYVPQIGAYFAAANGRVTQVNALAGVSQTQSMVARMGPLLVTMFVPMPTDRDMYGAASIEIRDLIDAYLAEHDGSDQAALDALTKALPPHYSLQFKEQFLEK